jgi:hypothetical protein
LVEKAAREATGTTAPIIMGVGSGGFDHPPLLEIPEEIYGVRKAALQVLKPLTRTWVSSLHKLEVFLKTINIVSFEGSSISPYILGEGYFILKKINSLILDFSFDHQTADRISRIRNDGTIWYVPMDETTAKSTVLVYFTPIMAITRWIVLVSCVIRKGIIIVHSGSE